MQYRKELRSFYDRVLYSTPPTIDEVLDVLPRSASLHIPYRDGLYRRNKGILLFYSKGRTGALDRSILASLYAEKGPICLRAS